MRAYRAPRGFDGERPMPDGVLVLVEGTTIAGIEPGSAPAPHGVPVTELPGTTLLPGLVDAHVHLCADNTPVALDRLADLSDDELDEIVQESMRAQLAAGVTAVR